MESYKSEDGTYEMKWGALDKNQDAQAIGKEFFTLDEVASRWKFTRPTISRILKKNGIKVLKVGLNATSGDRVRVLDILALENEKMID